VSETAEATEQPTKTTTPHRFISKGMHFQIVHRPPLTRDNNSGGMIVVDRGHIIDFGTPFRVEGNDLPVGTYVTDDPEIVEWLRNADSFNVEFWEQGNEPDAVHPTMQELAPQIAAATAELDTDALHELLKAELATHNRPDVLAVLEASLGHLEANGG
jgi:hypothetical protein